MFDVIFQPHSRRGTYIIKRKQKTSDEIEYRKCEEIYYAIYDVLMSGCQIEFERILGYLEKYDDELDKKKMIGELIQVIRYVFKNKS